MLTVPLKTTIILGAIQALNKEFSAGTNGEFTDADLKLLSEVAEYSSALIHRMIDPKFQVGADDTARFISKLTDLVLITKMEELEIDEKLVEATGDAIIRREGVFPYKIVAPGSVAVVMTNPLDFAKREAFSLATDLSIDEVKVVSAILFEALVTKFFKGSKASAEGDVDIGSVTKVISEAYDLGAETGEVRAADLESEDSAPIIQLANRIVEDAYICGASDVHIEPMEKDLLVRYRIDGLLQEKLRLPKQVANALVTRLKIMCNLDISERRLPQDGRIVFKKYTKKNIDIDLRVATGPMNYGEKVVMRILDKQKSTLPLPALGFSEENLARYRECIRQPYGMILHCGPTGSGKSMTLYSALAEVNTPDMNIQTAEDPIEYTLPGLNQMQMNRQIGLTFARALRCYLRMDPDVILVGEIRDEETAQNAVQAALTGHLVLSTLHTNDSASAVSRLRDLGVPSFLLASTLTGSMAQRLLRMICSRCVKPTTLAVDQIAALGLGRPEDLAGKLQVAYGEGCPRCRGTGYYGRTGIFELLSVTPKVRAMIAAGDNVGEIAKVARLDGLRTLRENAVRKLAAGLTTFEEVWAATRDIEVQ